MQGYTGRPRPNNKLGYVGINQVPGGKYRATLRSVHLGTFDTLDDAVRARLSGWDLVEKVKARQKDKGMILTARSKES